MGPEIWEAGALNPKPIYFGTTHVSSVFLVVKPSKIIFLI